MMKKFISGVRELIERITVTVSLIKKQKPKENSFLSKQTVFNTTTPEGYSEAANMNNWLTDVRESLGYVKA